MRSDNEDEKPILPESETFSQEKKRKKQKKTGEGRIKGNFAIF